MTQTNPLLLVTGAGGQLGRLVVDELLKTVNPSNIIATVRDDKSANELKTLGVQVRLADYEKPATLDAAFKGVDRVLLISSNVVGGRLVHHRNVIEAAERAGVKLLAYTSILHADEAAEKLAEEHRQTEALLKKSRVPYVLLRNGWYNENDLMGATAAIEKGVLVGSSGKGKLSAAARVDYAAAAATILTSSDDQHGKVYELAGDTSYTKHDLAAELARQSGKAVVYKDIPEAELKAILLSAGLPDVLAAALADADAKAATNALFDEDRVLSGLIGRPTTPMAKSVAQAIHA